MPEVGDAAPAFDAVDGDGAPIRLSDFAGRTLVLYFYPKDSTPGCTAEACDFRDQQPDFAGVNAAVVGVSRDTPASHQKFAAKYNLPFRLLSDRDEAVCRAYDVIREKSLYGRIGLGVERTTFVIDGQGIIRAKFPKVSVKGHVEKVLAAVRAIDGA